MFVMPGDRAGRQRLSPSVFAASYTAPLLSTFTWVNQGTSTAIQTSNGGSILMNIAANASVNWRGLFLPQPTTPYKVIVQMYGIFSAVNSQVAGLYFYDGIKLEGIECLVQNANAITAETRTIANVNTGGTTTVAFGPSMEAPLWYQLRNDGSTLNYDFSLDGANFQNMHSDAIGAFLTPTQIGWGGLNVVSAGQQEAIWLLNWRTVANASLNG